MKLGTDSFRKKDPQILCLSGLNELLFGTRTYIAQGLDGY